jgi:hypothetical protein
MRDAKAAYRAAPAPTHASDSAGPNQQSSGPMYIERVVLKNIKGFQQADLDFRPDLTGLFDHRPEDAEFAGWAVITGDNGSGKTAFLRAVALALLGPDQARGIVQDLRGWITEGRKTGSISAELRPHHERDTTEKGGYPVKSLWAEVEIRPDDATGSISSADVFKKKKRGAANGPWSPATHGWLAIAYGPFRRMYGTSPEAQRLAMLPGRIPRFTTLFKEDATLGEGEQWIQELQYKRLEEEAASQFPIAGSVLEQLIELISDDYLRHGVTITDITADGIWLCDQAKRRMQLSDMSDGYRSALAMLIDIFRHMVDVYGTNILAKDDDGHSYVDRPAVVLIDEVEAHLHPDWQREIGFWLCKHFPRVQFVVTTHSPLICGAADGGRVFHLPQPNEGRPFRLSEDDYRTVIAGKPDEILLTPAFGLTQTRSPIAVRARERHALLVSKQLALGNLPESEEKELEQLALFVGGAN